MKDKLLLYRSYRDIDSFGKLSHFGTFHLGTSTSMSACKDMSGSFLLRSLDKQSNSNKYGMDFCTPHILD